LQLRDGKIVIDTLGALSVGGLSTAGMDGGTGMGICDLLDAMPVAVVLADLDQGRILFLNRKLTQLYGYGRSEVATLGDWAGKAHAVEEHRDRVLQSWARASRTERSRVTALQEPRSRAASEIDPVEVDIRCGDGTVKTAVQYGMILPGPGWMLLTFVDITDRKRDELLVRQLAEEDVLTGLPNRRAFEGHLEHAVADARRDGQGMHLLLLDLDHFKIVNDRLGHQGGDLLLQEVAERLKSCVRASDVVARFGGDEFAIILRRSGSDEAVARICDKVLATVRCPFGLAGELVRVGVSIGVGRFPEDAAQASELFEAADRALYRVKEQGRGHWRYALRED